MKEIDLISEEQGRGKDKVAIPSFGFVSALPIATIFLPYAVIVLIAIVFCARWDLTLLCLFCTVLARFMGDWVFWSKYFPEEMDTGENDENWRAQVKHILLSQPSATNAISDMIFDAVIDGILLFCVFKYAAFPMWALFVYSLCLGIGAPIQGIVLRIFDRKYVRKFSMIMAVFGVFIVLETSGVTSVGYIRALGLSQFSASSQILVTVGIKSLLSSTSIIAKEVVAENIKLATLKRVEL